MRKFFWAIFFALLFYSACADAKSVYILTIDGAIGPATQYYIHKGLTTARDERATLVILNLNTPGGLEKSTRKIIQEVSASPVPVISYVSPADAHAANGGIVILYASHLAAMAPNTYLGTSPQPNMSTTNSLKDKLSLNIFKQKIINNDVINIRSLAELRHRNADWAESAIRSTPYLSAEEALKEKIINIIANDIPQLLQKVNGTTTEINHIPVTLDTQDATIVTLSTNWQYQALSIITNPIMAYLLMLAGILGVFLAFKNINKALPAFIGAVCILLAFYAYQLLSLNFIGLTLLLIGIACMITGMAISRFGMTGIVGLVSFICGSFFLIDLNVPGYHLAWSFTLLISLACASIFFLILLFTLGTLRKPKSNAMVGKTGEVLEYHADHVIVNIQGQIWSAQSSKHLGIGQKIRVTKISNRILTVEPIL